MIRCVGCIARSRTVGLALLFLRILLGSGITTDRPLSAVWVRIDVVRERGLFGFPLGELSTASSESLLLLPLSSESKKCPTTRHQLTKESFKLPLNVNNASDTP